MKEKNHRLGCEVRWNSLSCECPLKANVTGYDARDKDEASMETLSPAKYDGWAEGTPMFSVGVPGIALQVGTTFTSGYGDIHLKISLNGTRDLTTKEYRGIVRAARRRLHEIINDNKARSTVALLSPDEPQFVPQHKPQDASWVVCFWMTPPAGKSGSYDDDNATEVRNDEAAADLSFTRGRAVMGLRLPFSNTNVQDIKAALKAERRSEAAGVWMPKPWALWVVWDHRAVAGVLGRLRKAGHHLLWINREGFPAAPPIEDSL